MKAMTGNRNIGEHIMTAAIKRRMASKRRRAFTLVEVIVVLVILAILAAIAIPALTGYINKAEDKKYIAEARNAMAALRAVIDEAYADGTINKGMAERADTGNIRPDFITYGTHSWDGQGSKYWNLQYLGLINEGVSTDNVSSPAAISYYRKAAELMGTSYPEAREGAGAWWVFLYAPKAPDSAYSIVNAPAFLWIYFPDGYTKTTPPKTCIAVTYGLDYNFTSTTSLRDLWIIYQQGGYCNADAGYKVFYDVNIDY